MSVIYFIVISYSIMTLIELTAIHSKLAGFFNKRFAISFTLYNSTMAITRLFYMVMMPFLGYIVDNGISNDKYTFMVFLSLWISFLFSVIVNVLRSIVINFYSSVILLYLENENGFLSCIKKAFLSTQFNSFNSVNFSRELTKSKYFYLSVFIYSIQSIGIFSTYFIALNNPDYRVTISQLSAVVNAFATALLTLKLEPMLSRSMENSDNFEFNFYSVYWGRSISFLFIGPFLIFLLNMVIR